MRKLPHWVLTDKFPAFYDIESLTAVEQTARLYGAMQELIADYNKFVDSLNAEIEKFETDTNSDTEKFKLACNQKFQEFIEVVDLKLKDQDREIAETIKYIKTNISDTVSSLIDEMQENGELSEVVLNSFEETKNILNVFRTELENYQEEVRAGIEEFKSETNEKITELETVEKARKVLYPELTQEQKNAISSLARSYYNNRNMFHYYDKDVTRNTFAGNGCYTDEKTKFKLNCSMFAQFIFMGRDISDFIGKNADTYSNKITKAFDFGYYFNFKNRRFYGLTKKDAEGNISGYWGFRKAHDAEGDYTSSFSYNSYYAQGSERLYKQAFRSYMDACDMAMELQRMGCEIPRSELQVGDIVFTESTIVNDDNNSEFVRHAFKNITHVLIVSKVNEDGSAHFIDCTDAGDADTMPIMYCGVDATNYDFDRVRGLYIEENIVMCARHPVAFGYASNVPENIERI